MLVFSIAGSRMKPFPADPQRSRLAPTRSHNFPIGSCWSSVFRGISKVLNPLRVVPPSWKYLVHLTLRASCGSNWLRLHSTPPCICSCDTVGPHHIQLLLHASRKMALTRLNGRRAPATKLNTSTLPLFLEAAISDHATPALQVRAAKRPDRRNR
jgi:hypothetical protein